MVVTVAHAEVTEGGLQAQKLLGVPMEGYWVGGKRGRIRVSAGLGQY